MRNIPTMSSRRAHNIYHLHHHNTFIQPQMSYFAQPGFAFSLQLHINRVSKFKTRCTSSKLCSYIFLSCLYSVLPICLPLPHAPVLSLHHQPAKPDSQAAYQAFCQPGCLIVLSKHPPAFRLPPPPQKTSPGQLARSSPHCCFSSISLAACFRFSHFYQCFFFFFFLLAAYLTSLFSHSADRFTEVFLPERQMALRKCLTSRGLLLYTSCIHLELSLSKLTDLKQSVVEVS